MILCNFAKMLLGSLRGGEQQMSMRGSKFLHIFFNCILIGRKNQHSKSLNFFDLVIKSLQMNASFDMISTILVVETCRRQKLCA